MRAMELRHAANHDTFGERLRRAREHTCVKAEDLADRAGITTKRVQSLETGGSSPPTPDQVNRMAGALKVSPLWLMAGELAGEKFVPSWYRQGGAA